MSPLSGAPKGFLNAWPSHLLAWIQLLSDLFPRFLYWSSLGSECHENLLPNNLLFKPRNWNVHGWSSLQLIVEAIGFRKHLFQKILPNTVHISAYWSIISFSFSIAFRFVLISSVSDSVVSLITVVGNMVIWFTFPMTLLYMLLEMLVQLMESSDVLQHFQPAEDMVIYCIE